MQMRGITSSQGSMMKTPGGMMSGKSGTYGPVMTATPQAKPS